jgi:hypothetical protein
LALVLGAANVQARIARAQPATTAPAGKAAEDKAIEKLDLETKDNVQLSVNYYKSKLGKEAAVVLILHHDKGSKQDYDGLAKELQAAGHAVVVPDLRGFGTSTKVLIKKEVAGELKVTDTKPITATRKQDFEAMIAIDLERIKTMLFERHNAGEFNIRKLCVIGVEMGAVLALNWSLLVDWEWQTLLSGPQGKDVRGLILVSPRWNHKGLVINKAIEQGQYIAEIPTLIMVGSKDTASLNDAKRVNDQFGRYLPEPPEAEVAEKKNLFFFQFDTTLQGFKLLNERKLDPDPVALVKLFLDNRVRGNKLKWETRK